MASPSTPTSGLSKSSMQDRRVLADITNRQAAMQKKIATQYSSSKPVASSRKSTKPMMMYQRGFLGETTGRLTSATEAYTPPPRPVREQGWGAVPLASCTPPPLGGGMPFTPKPSTPRTGRNVYTPTTAGSRVSSVGSPPEATPSPPPSPTDKAPRTPHTRVNATRLAYSPTAETPRAVRTRLLPPQAPEFEGKLTVVFDLDETLVSNRSPISQPAIIRPYLQYMFRKIAGLAECVMWTASTEDTGRPVINQIDPNGQHFQHLIFRNDKWFTEPAHTKDLTLLGRSMDKVLIVENTPNCCKLNPRNSIIVEDFTGHNMDDVLLGSVSDLIEEAAAAVKRGVSIQNFLAYSAARATHIEECELGLPYAFQRIPYEEAMRQIRQLDPLMQPPMGNYYYVRK